MSTIPRTVQSVEEVITELHNTIKKLQQMWEPIKTQKTKEYYDSSLQKVKFGEIFFFDIFIKIKPIFETIPEHVVEKELEEKDTKNQTEILQFGNIIDANERNKYVIIDESAVSEGTKGVRHNINSLKNNIEEAYQQEIEFLKEQDYIIQQRQASLERQALLESTSLVSSEVAMFLQHNMQFWQQVNDTLRWINLSAKNLRNRIQKEE